MTATAYDRADVPCALCHEPSFGLWISGGSGVPFCWDCDTSCGSFYPNCTPWSRVPAGTEVVA